VILRGAEQRLKDEFPEEVRRKFKFFFLAEDDEKDGSGYVSPGIGGSVCERLGITEQGLGFVPLIVKERRTAHLAMDASELAGARKAR
jgi:hypothetical protein